MRGDLPTDTVTFLFTDIEASTRLLHALGPNDYAHALAEHRRVLRESFAAHGGVEVDTQGDAFFVAFPTAEGAAAAAVAAEERLASGSIRVRMGLHTGTPTLTAEGYVGVDVHRGARVAALAHGGQIVLSPTTAALLDGSPLRDLGEHRLKDFDGSIRLHQLGTHVFPPLRTAGSVDLPTPATRFLGREQELFAAVSLVYEHDPRVLTILGPGGTGKTRFSIELARLLAEDADGGTVFVPLAPLRDPGLVLAAIADRLGAASPELMAVVSHVGDRRTHVVVDNAEHLLPDAAGSLAELVGAAPTLRFVVTSREALRVQGEHELDLPPLAEPEAVELFLARARAVQPDLAPTTAVSELCARLDRLPLALELAAARTKLLSPEALLERLGDRLDLLKGTRDADERHATLRTTIAWSYDLLAAGEQRLFRALSVFRGGCTLGSAEAVCDADVDTLGSLLDKSLLRRRTGRLGEERYWMLETIREFAFERLDASADARVVRQRHAERMLEVARSAHLTEEDDETLRLPIVLAEREDIRAALDWATANDVQRAFELVIALENFWHVHANEELVSRLDALLCRDGVSPELRAGALRLRGGALHVLGRFDECDAPYEESLALYRELADERGSGSLLHRLANSALQRGEIERARALIDESQELVRGRYPVIEMTNTTLLGQIAIRTDDVEGGRELLRQSADMAADVGFLWWRSGILSQLAFLAADRGNVEEAERAGREALRLVRSDEGRSGTLLPLVALARAALVQGQPARAGVLWGAVETEAERTLRSTLWQRRRAERAGPLLDETDIEFIGGVEDGKQLEVWDAVAIALGELELPQTVP